MKIVLSLMLLTCLSFNESKAQSLKENEIPVKVREAYKKKYPAAKEGKWKKQGEAFEVSQMVNKKHTVVLYDDKGKIIKSETEMKFAELPKMMTDFIVANLKGQNPSSACRITDNAGKISYAAEIDHLRYVFDDKGNFIKQEQGSD